MARPQTPNPILLTNALIASVLSIASTGCLALGVPSQRFHDAADQGGILGDFRHSKAPAPAGVTEAFMTEGAILVPPHSGLSGSCCGSGEPTVMGGDVNAMDVHPVTGSCLEPAEEPPEVPWPRFHPVPNSPGFWSDGVLTGMIHGPFTD